MKNKNITYIHLKRFLTCQPYFIWHSNVIKNMELNLDDEDYSENNEFNLWNICMDFDEDDENSKYFDFVKNAYEVINSLFEEHVFKDRSFITKGVYEKTIEASFKKTMELLNDESVDQILNPVFIYNGNVVATPSLYNKKTKTLSSIVHSSKSKLSNYIQAYFETSILKKLKIKVNEYTFFFYDSDYLKYTKPRQLFFKERNTCDDTKNKSKNFWAKDIEEQIKKKKYKYYPIIQKLNSGMIKEGSIKNEPIILSYDNFDWYIEQIQKAKDLTNYNVDEISKDVTEWGDNSEFNNFFPFEKVNIKQISGNVLNKKELINLFINNETVDDLEKKKKSLLKIINNESDYDEKSVLDLINMLSTSNVVWYDFEGFNMPFSIMEYVPPYQQIVFQVSVIRTTNEKITNINNVVIDPKKLNIDELIKIVDAIYNPDVDYYVVYNKSYENTRLNEIKKLLIQKDFFKYSSICEKISTIINKTKDLYDWFSITNSDTKIPPIFISDLNCYTSIKKIEKYIHANNINLEVMVTPYSELEVQNGLMAMNKAIQRYLGSIGDKEWETTVENLKQYCENDVKAMIMVYYFMKYLLSKNNKKIQKR